ncbi:dethiobiotin synthase [Kocuria marina]|uniref:ATP-dependent dethiobiotin synthetase BioD n=1 Tax=Kocuria marina subsp. indica TaxID=1049583 RepID=A0A1X7DW27_9MICC|nr:dethiobiotin synthase [Kocuria indica]OXS81203.1 dethiobiotin synthase [Kocuria indica]RLP57039.1 dethiobiotin synthase [Kocuria indica]SMF22680.1 dethiobiotin synthetase [Kocuria indica]
MTHNPLAHAPLPRITIVTGTDTDVGKTYTTAALAVAAWSSGVQRIAVYKPQQTGVRGDDPGDVDDVARLAHTVGVPSAALTVAEGQRLTEPMAPPPAAAIDGVDLLSITAHVERVMELQESHDLVLVEGSGGVLVELDGQQHTIADLARELQGRAGEDAGTVVVTRPDLGTLNHTLLTLEALHHRGVRVSGVVLGSWPAHPDPVQESNRDYLADLPDVSGHHIPLLGAVPAGWNVGVS